MAPLVKKVLLYLSRRSCRCAGCGTASHRISPPKVTTLLMLGFFSLLCTIMEMDRWPRRDGNMHTTLTKYCGLRRFAGPVRCRYCTSFKLNARVCVSRRNVYSITDDCLFSIVFHFILLFARIKMSILSSLIYCFYFLLLRDRDAKMFPSGKFQSRPQACHLTCCSTALDGLGIRKIPGRAPDGLG